MSNDVYQIAVSMHLTNFVSVELGQMAKSFDATSARADAFKKRLEGIKGLAESGKKTFAFGLGMLEQLKAPLDNAMELERISASLKQKGLGDAQVADAMKFVKANDIYGTSMVDRAKIFNKAQGQFGQSGLGGEAALAAAKTMTPILAGYQVATGTLDGKPAEAAADSFKELNGIVKLMGGLNDTARATSIVDAVFKSVQASGHAVSEADLRAFITQGGGAVAHLSDKTLFGALQPLMGSMGGAELGGGMQAAYQSMAGLTPRPSSTMVAEATKLHIWDKNQIEYDKQGGMKGIRDHTKLLDPDLLDAMQHNTTDFVRKLLAIYQGSGIDTVAKRERENAILFGADGAKAYDQLMRQIVPMEQADKAFDGQQGPKALNDAQKESPMQKLMEAQSKFSDALTNLGVAVLPMVTQALQQITPMLQSLGDWMTENPKTVKFLTQAFVDLGVALVIGGGIATLVGGFKKLSMALEFANMGGPIGIEKIATSLTSVGGALRVVGGAAGVLMAAYAGWQFGKQYYDGLKPKEQEDIGGWMTTIMANFGNKEAQESLDAMAKADQNNPNEIERQRKMEAERRRRVHATTPASEKGPTKEAVRDAVAAATPPVVNVEVHNYLNGKDIYSDSLKSVSLGTTAINPTSIRLNPAMGSAGY